MSEETILLTGGTGFIGSYLAKDLLEDNHDVVLCDIAPEVEILKSLGISENVDVRQTDVTELSSLLNLVKETRADRIIHLAALLTDGVRDNPRRGTKINILGLNNVLEVASILDVKRVIWASSTTVYAPPDNYTEPVSENDLVYPDTLYGGTKVYNELMAREYANSNFSIVGIRPSLTYGPYRKTGGSTFITDIIEKAALEEPYSVKYGDQIINWHYIRDVVQAFHKATFVSDENLTRSVYNTGGEAASIRTLVNIVTDIVPTAEIDVSDEGQLPWMQKIDISNARDDLDYNPQYDLRKGVKEYIQILRDEHDLTPI